MPLEAGPLQVQQSMVCLGASLDPTGCMQATKSDSFQKADQSWRRVKRGRGRGLHKSVVSSVLWGYQLWLLSRRADDFVEAVEAR